MDEENKAQYIIVKDGEEVPLPPEEAGSRLSEEEGEEAGLSEGQAEEIAQPRLELDQRISSLKNQVQDTLSRAQEEEATEQNLQEELKERKARVVEDTKLMPLLTEAERALKDFQQQVGQRLDADQKDAKDFEELVNMVETLRQQRDKAMGAIKDFGDRVAGALGNTIDEFIKRLEGLEIKKVQLYEREDQQGKILADAKAKLDEVVQKALAMLPPDTPETTKVLIQDLQTPSSYLVYLAGLEECRKKLGWFNFKQKRAFNFISEQQPLFLDADHKAQELASVVQDVKLVEREIAETTEQYKQQILQFDVESA